MTDKKKQPESRRTEDLSPAELRAQIEEDKKKVSRSTVFLFAALIAIIVICIAWFVANTRVNVTTGTISAQDSTLFELASVGSRTEAENEKLKDEVGKNLLTAGTGKPYDSYYEYGSNGWKKVSTSQSYHVGTADLAWYLQSANGTVSPGASGKLEFYIIPKVDNLKSVEVTLDLEAYQNAESTSDRAVKSSDNTLQNLVQGHILLFRNLNGNNVGYSGWIKDGKLKITPSGIQITTDETTVTDTDDEKKFEQGKPYKVTVYWVWPKYFRNYIYNERNNWKDDLFGPSGDKKTQTPLLNYVKEQAKLSDKSNNKLFYIKNGEKGISDPDSIGANMLDEVLDECSKYYNAADEYIGTYAKYLYVKAAATGKS